MYSSAKLCACVTCLMSIYWLASCARIWPPDQPQPTWRLCAQASGGFSSIEDQSHRFEAIQGFLKSPTPQVQPTDPPLPLSEVLEGIWPGMPANKVPLITDPLLYLSTHLDGLEHTGIPPVLHMTVPDKDALPPHTVLTVASWAVTNPGLTLLLYNDEDVAQYVAKYAPEFRPDFLTLGSAVERSDLWRYIVVCTHGGVYADSDTVAAGPLSRWLSITTAGTRRKRATHYAINDTSDTGDTSDAGDTSGTHGANGVVDDIDGSDTNVDSGSRVRMVIGIENAFPTLKEAQASTYVKQVQFLQWIFAGTRGAHLACAMPARIRAAMAEEEAQSFVGLTREAAILQRTGPGVWSKAVEEEVLRPAGKTPLEVVGGEAVGEVLIQPQVAFGCGDLFWSPRNTLSLAYHQFTNTWRTDREHLAALAVQRKAAELWRSRRRMVRVWALVVSAMVVMAGVGVCKYKQGGSWVRQLVVGRYRGILGSTGGVLTDWLLKEV